MCVCVVSMEEPRGGHEVKSFKATLGAEDYAGYTFFHTGHFELGLGTSERLD